VTREFLGTFALTMTAFVTIYVMADFFDRLNSFLSHDAPPGAILRSFVFKLPLVITQVTPMRDLRHWENGGYFLMRPRMFEFLNENEDLVEDVIVRLVRRGMAIAYPYKGYWSPADTVKERAQLEERFHRADCPWMIWDPERSAGSYRAPASTDDSASLDIT